MSAPRKPARFAAFTLTGALLALGCIPGATARADGEDEAKDLDELVARLRNPFFAKQADRDLQIVQLLLRQKTARADAYLRDLLADTGAHPTVIEQIAIATLIDAEHRLLPEVVDRLRREAGSELDRSLDVAFLTYSDGALVQRLSELAHDATRPTAFRAEAIVLLGRTGSAEALDPLIDLWGGPQKELREPAARAFDRVLPAGAATREEAVLLREEIRSVPFTEALRRLLRRHGGAAAPAPSLGPVEGDYVKLAKQMIARAGPAQVMDLWLGSPVADIRAMGARRLAEWDFGGTETFDGPDIKVRAARACLAALRREDVEAVEIDLFAALSALSPELRGAVGEADLAALADRVKLDGRASNAVRLAAVRLMGELRDPRCVPLLSAAFEGLGDSDVELRLVLLDALQQAPGDLTPWLISRLAAESHTRVVRKIVVLLNRAEAPAVIDAFRRLLASHPDQQVRWDVAKALGTHWAGRQIEAARDALLDIGLKDADPTVRRTCAAALGEAGGAGDAIVKRLLTLLESETDPKVRQAAAKSVVDLDPAGAARGLLPYVADDVEIWRLYRDRLVEDVRRRDKTPARVLGAADVLAANGLSRLAVDLLSQVSAERDGLWDNDSGRTQVLERLAVLLLDQGDPDGARTTAQQLVDVTPKDAGAPRQHAELLLAKAQCRSGRRDELRLARALLETLRAAATVAAPDRAEADVELGDCLLRLEDPVAAMAVLSPAAARSDVPAALTKKASQLLEDAKRRADEEKKRVLAWVDDLEGKSAEAAQKGLRDLGPRAAPYLLAAFDDAKDAPRLRRLIRAASQALGRPLAEPADGASDGDVAKSAEDARAALRKAAANGNGAVR